MHRPAAKRPCLTRSRDRRVGVAIGALAIVLAAGASVVGGLQAAGVIASSRTTTPTGKPSGVVQAGDSKTTCIFANLVNYNLPASLSPVDRATHVRFNCLETYSNADVTWYAWTHPWVTQKPYGYAEWLAKDPKGRTVIITQSLIPDNVAANPDWQGLCARGEYRSFGRQLASNLVTNGFEYSVIRLGPEMNGTWYRDSLGSTVAEWKTWARCYAQIVVAMRSVHGEHFLFDWNVNAGYRDIPLRDYYPGNKYVDIIGIDTYDSGGGVNLPAISSPRRWDVLASEPLGLEGIERFAVAHGKPLSIPEWGTVQSSQGGDDGAYVHHMGVFIASHDVAYQSWFDAGSDGILPLAHESAPRSLAAYVAAFGPGSFVARYQVRTSS